MPFNCNLCNHRSTKTLDFPCIDCVDGEFGGTMFNYEPSMTISEVIELVNTIDFSCSDRAYDTVQEVLEKLQERLENPR